MSARTIATIYGKELRDMLRDRRTLISMIVVPTFIMPAVLLAATKLATGVVAKAKAEIPRVMVIGGADSPGLREELVKSGKFRVEDATGDWKSLISEKKVRAAVEIPAGFEKALAAGEAPAVTLYDYQGELKSGLAEGQLNDFFVKLRTRATATLLAARGLPPSIARPFEVKQVNVAPPEKVGGNLFGGIVPYFIVILCLTGAMYPAIDLTAGEKERGTMETLLCSPAARSDIVLGKFLMILTASLTAVFLSMLSLMVSALILGAAISQGHGMVPAPGTPSVDPVGMLGVLALTLPVSVLFSACVFTIALFAKGLKEAQSYLTPLTMIVIIPSTIGLIPGVELTLPLSFVPVINVALVSKEMLSGVWHWGEIGIIFGSTATYAVVALLLAVRMFGKENVIFRT